MANTIDGVLMRAFNPLRLWLSEQLSVEPRDETDAAASRKSRRIRLAVSCAIVFLIATGVRSLHWDDGHLQTGLSSLTTRYIAQARKMMNGEGVLFPRDKGNVQMIVHPPGYSIFIAALYSLFGESRATLTIAQIILDGAAAVMVVLIAAELLPLALACVAGLLVAFSPHLSHYALFLLPDSLAALPLLIAVYLLIKATKRPRLMPVIAAGILIGLSCWLRSNALLLMLFVACATPFLFERGKRLRNCAAVVGAAVLTIAPVTIRNLVVFGHFIPLSLGAGITMIEGIADYDAEKRFGMPVSDLEGKMKDVEWHDREDYGEGLWKPDGIYRDQYRFRRGLEVIGSNPLWFAGVMVRRAAFMLSYNSATSVGWPLDTARVPVVAREASFGHQLQVPADQSPAWQSAAEEIKASGKQLARQAVVSLSPDGQSLQLAGDDSDFGDQLTTLPIAVEKNTDYVLRLAARHASGLAAAKVTSADRRVTLAYAFIVKPDERALRKARRLQEAEADDFEESSEDDLAPEAPAEASMSVFEMAFATGDRSEVLLVISNNGKSVDPPVVEIRQAALYKMGATPRVWTKLVRPAIRGIQRNLYTTSTMLPLVIIGMTLLAAAGRKRALVLLLVVPVYYLAVQSAFHTEYRYILAIHYFLFIMAAVSLYLAGKLFRQGALSAIRAIRSHIKSM